MESLLCAKHGAGTFLAWPGESSPSHEITGLGLCWEPWASPCKDEWSLLISSSPDWKETLTASGFYPHTASIVATNPDRPQGLEASKWRPWRERSTFGVGSFILYWLKANGVLQDGMFPYPNHLDFNSWSRRRRWDLIWLIIITQLP